MNLIRFGGPNVLGFSVANERKASKATTGRLKAQGLMPGAPDYVVLWDGGGALIEFKTAKGRVSPAQQNFGKRATDVQWPYFVCRSWQDAFLCLEAAIAPLRHILQTKPIERFVLAEA